MSTRHELNLLRYRADYIAYKLHCIANNLPGHGWSFIKPARPSEAPTFMAVGGAKFEGQLASYCDIQVGASRILNIELHHIRIWRLDIQKILKELDERTRTEVVKHGANRTYAAPWRVHRQSLSVQKGDVSEEVAQAFLSMAMVCQVVREEVMA